MQPSFNLTQQPEKQSGVHPTKFLLWITMGSMIMLFAAFTSAYVVRKSAGEWLVFQLPNIFWYSTFVIFISSLTMHGAYWALKRNKFSLVQWSTFLTFILGVSFAVLQWLGWQELAAQGIRIAGNPAASFVYVITGAHVVHLLGGLVFLLFMLFKSFRHTISAKNSLPMQLCTTYWHFMDGLWIYLFFFLLLYR